MWKTGWKILKKELFTLYYNILHLEFLQFFITYLALLISTS